MLVTSSDGITGGSIWCQMESSLAGGDCSTTTTLTSCFRDTHSHARVAHCLADQMSLLGRVVRIMLHSCWHMAWTASDFFV